MGWRAGGHGAALFVCAQGDAGQPGLCAATRCCRRRRLLPPRAPAAAHKRSPHMHTHARTNTHTLTHTHASTHRARARAGRRDPHAHPGGIAVQRLAADGERAQVLSCCASTPTLLHAATKNTICQIAPDCSIEGYFYMHLPACRSAHHDRPCLVTYYMWQIHPQTCWS